MLWFPFESRNHFVVGGRLKTLTWKLQSRCTVRQKDVSARSHAAAKCEGKESQP
jgi:hypothetical protein